MHSVLKSLVDESAEVRSILSAAGQITLLNSAEDNARKALVLAAASLFEHRITEALLKYAETVSNSDGCVVSLIRNKAIKRQFHTFFDWDQKKIGTFQTLLGESIGGNLKSLCSESPGKEQSTAFLEIGYLRNCLVHKNYAVYM